MLSQRITDECRGKVVLKIGGIERIEVTERAYWSDAAGVLAVNVAPDAEQLADIKARKGEFIDAAVLKKPVP